MVLITTRTRLENKLKSGQAQGINVVLFSTKHITDILRDALGLKSKNKSN